MVNLYQILKLPPHASESEIRAALQHQQANLAPKVVKGVQEWLLVPDVRVRYDAQLRQHQPDFFIPQEKPKFIQDSNDLYNNKEYEPLPPLWNPNAAACWSILCGLPFGALLHAKNWLALGEAKLAQANFYWGLVGFILINVSIYSSNPVIFGSARLALLMTLIAWYFALAKKQVTYFREQFDDKYERKGWLKPILLWLVLAFIVGFLAGVYHFMMAMSNIPIE